MLRYNLHKYSGLICIFEGTVATFGRHKQTEEPTILLINVKGITFDDIEISHTWCIQNESFNENSIRKGTIIEFEAVITPYGKGTKDKNGKSKYRDYGLANPTVLKIVGRDKKFDTVEILPPSRRISIIDIMNTDRSNIPKRN